MNGRIRFPHQRIDLDDRAAVAAVKVLAGWYHGFGPIHVPDLQAAYFNDPRHVALWSVIRELGDAASTDYDAFGRVQDLARERSGLPEEDWDGVWKPIMEADQGATVASMQEAARVLRDEWEKRHGKRVKPAAPSESGGSKEWVEGPPEGNRFALWHASEALEPIPPVEWIVDKLIQPGGFSVWYGAQASKKSYAMAWLATCVASGKDWLGFKTKPSRVLIVDEESGKPRLRMRIREVINGALAERDLPLDCLNDARLKLDNPDDMAALEAIVEENKIDLVIIDGLAKVMSGDENSKQDTQVVMDRLSIAAHRTRAHFLVLHHSGKSGEIRGSSTFQASPDLIVEITSRQGSRYVHFKVVKNRDGEPMEWSAKATWVTHDDPSQSQFYMEWAPNRRGETGRSPLQQWILDFLRENGESALPAIMAAGVEAEIGGKYTIRDTVYALVKEEVIHRTNPEAIGHAVAGRYALTEPDESEMDQSEPDENEPDEGS